MRTSDAEQLQPFFSNSHWARLGFMVLLAVAFGATTAQAVWQLLQSNASFSGQFVEVSEARTDDQKAIYTLVLQPEGEELLFLELHNNGRILNYLLSQGEKVTGPMTAVVRQDAVIEIMVGEDLSGTIREARIAPSIQLLIGMFPLLLLILHMRPRLVVGRKS